MSGGAFHYIILHLDDLTIKGEPEERTTFQMFVHHLFVFLQEKAVGSVELHVFSGLEVYNFPDSS